MSKIDKSLAEVERELGEPLHISKDSVNSDLRQFYGTDKKSTYSTYLDSKYEKLFGKTPQAGKDTVAEYLESAESEMVRNAAEWGNDGYLNRNVTVTRKFYADKVLIIVEDQGRGFDYKKVLERDVELAYDLFKKREYPSQDEIDDAPFYSTRRSAYKNSGLKASILRKLEKTLKKPIGGSGGQGFKRLIFDSYGNFNYNSSGNQIFYVLPLPAGVRLTKENAEKFNGDDFKDFLRKKGIKFD